MQKSGTTWLYEALKGHPQLQMPPIKELHFFDEIERQKGISKVFSTPEKRSYLSIQRSKSFQRYLKGRGSLWEFLYYCIPRRYSCIGLYKSMFKQGLCGDITPSYSCLSLQSIRRIRKDFRDLKVLLILRNPIDREWSQIKMDVHRNNYNEEQKKSLMKEWSLAHNVRSDYFTIIKNWTSVFHDDEILICYYDLLASDPHTFLARIYEFLAVEEFYPEKVLKQRIFTGLNQSIPDEIRVNLAKKHIPMLSSLLGIRGVDQLIIDKWLTSAKSTMK